MAAASAASSAASHRRSAPDEAATASAWSPRPTPTGRRVTELSCIPQRPSRRVTVATASASAYRRPSAALLPNVTAQWTLSGVQRRMSGRSSRLWCQPAVDAGRPAVPGIDRSLSRMASRWPGRLTWDTWRSACTAAESARFQATKRERTSRPASAAASRCQGTPRRCHPVNLPAPVDATPYADQRRAGPARSTIGPGQRTEYRVGTRHEARAYGRPGRWPSRPPGDRRRQAGELLHAHAQDPREGQRVGQARIDPAALEVDQPALGTADQVGEAGLRETAPLPVDADLLTDRRSHGWMLLATHPGAGRRTRRGQCGRPDRPDRPHAGRLSRRPAGPRSGRRPGAPAASAPGAAPPPRTPAARSGSGCGSGSRRAGRSGWARRP